jgi:hypothetical protein
MSCARLPSIFAGLGLGGGAFALLVAACSETSTTKALASADGSAVPPGPPAPADAAAADRFVTSTSVRFANLSAALGRIDVCYRRTGSDQFVGPLLGPADGGTDAGAGDGADDAGAFDAGATSGLAPRGVTGYWMVEGSGTFRVDVIRAGSTSCADPVASAEVTLEAGRYATVTVIDGRAGGGGPRDAGPDAESDDGGLDASPDAYVDAASTEVSIAALADDLGVVPDKARVRVVHAALPVAPGAVAVSAIDGTRSVPLAPRVEPGRAASAAPQVDARGYASIAPLADPQGLRIDGLDDAGPASWSTALSPLGLRAGSNHTGFVAAGGTGLGVVWCDDTATGTIAACAWIAAQ